MALFSELGVAVALGAVAILVLVGIAWRRRTRRLRARPRPASPEVVDADQRRRTLRSIAANDYHRQSRHEE
jgi:hypothetical protein